MDNWHSLPGGVSCITHGPYPAGRPESTHVRAVKVPEFVFRGSLINAGCAVLFIPPKYPQYPSGWPFVIMLMPLYVFCCGGPGARILSYIERARSRQPASAMHAPGPQYAYCARGPRAGVFSKAARARAPPLTPALWLVVMPAVAMAVADCVMPVADFLFGSKITLRNGNSEMPLGNTRTQIKNKNNNNNKKQHGRQPH